MLLVLLPVITAVWVFVNLVFANWRVHRLRRKGGERLEPLKDWAVQVFYRGTALVCLILVVLFATCWRE